MTEPAADPVAPVACPDCLSDQLKGPDQAGAELSYWRCLKCGVVWNPKRLPHRSTSRGTERATQRRSVSDYWHDK